MHVRIEGYFFSTKLKKKNVGVSLKTLNSHISWKKKLSWIKEKERWEYRTSQIIVKIVSMLMMWW